MKKNKSQIQQCPQCGRGIRATRMAAHMKNKCEWRPLAHPYADIFQPSEIPEWIENLSKVNVLPTPIPLIDVLRNSCFYPASGSDASPVRLVNGYIHSFIFADYSTERSVFFNEISARGFYGYKCILQRDIDPDEIVPPNWMPQMPRHFDNPGFDGFKRLMETQKLCKPFGHWSLWRRTESYGNTIGPRLFSFFFLGGEALACYQGLYLRNRIVPNVLAIIQPGHILGDNWTDFTDRHAPLWKTVSTGGDLPKFVLIGYSGKWSPTSKECPFDGYTFLKRTYFYGRHRHACAFCRHYASLSYPECMSSCGLEHTIDIFRITI